MLRIEYQDGLYKPARLQVRLIYNRQVANTPIEVTEIRLDPKGILRLERDTHRSTAVIAVYDVHPDHDLLANNRKFWEEVGSLTSPVKVTVCAKPAQGYAKPKLPIILGHTEIEARPPDPELHWYDMRSLPPARDPACIHLRADGEDHFELRVECKMWLPESRRFEYHEGVVEFSHYLPNFREDVFGPSPHSRPWVVAKPGSADNREYSWWESKVVLPTEKHPDLTVPLRETMRVRAWPRGSIIQREVNRVIPKPGTRNLAETHLAIQLDPELVKAEIIEPKEPIPADGKAHAVVLEIRKRRDGSLLKQGELSFKLETAGNPPGGTVTPERILVKEADSGRVRIDYTPPRLKYRPGRSFEQRLHVAVGTGDKAVHSDTVKVDVNPALQARIDAEKCGLDWPRPYELNLAAGETPSSIDAHIGMDFRDELAGQSCRRSVGDARPVVSVVDDDGDHPLTIEGRTARSPEDIAGRFIWWLPELEQALRSLPENRRTRRLREFEESPLAIFDFESQMVFDQYQMVLDSERGRKLFRPSGSLWGLMHPALEPRLVARGTEMAGHLAEGDEKDCQKARNGTTLTKAALQGTIAVDNLHSRLLSDAINLLGKFFWDLVDYLIKAYKVGEKVLKSLPNAPGWLGGWIQRLIEVVKLNPYLGPRVGPAVEALEAIARRLAEGASNIGPMLKGYWDTFLLRYAEQVSQWMAWATSELMTKTLGKVGSKAIEKIVKAVGKILTGAASGQIGEMSGPEELATLIRHHVGEMSGVGINATEALDSVTTDVYRLRFSPADKESCESAVSSYLQGVIDLEEERGKLLTDFKQLDDRLKLLSNTLDVLFVIAAAAAILLSAGWATPAIAVLSQAGWGKIAVNVLGHSYEAMNLLVLAAGLDDKYLRLSLELTR